MEHIYNSKSIFNVLLLLGLLLHSNNALTQNHNKLHENRTQNATISKDDQRLVEFRETMNKKLKNYAKSANERLIAETGYSDVGVIYDSTYYSYSGNRGGNDPYDVDKIAYDDYIFRPDYDESVRMFNYNGSLVNYNKHIKTYDNHNNLLTNNIYNWSEDHWVTDIYSSNYAYNALDYMTSLYTITSSEEYQIAFTYDDSNRLIEEKLDGTYPYRRTFFYDAENHNISIIHERSLVNGVYKSKDSTSNIYDTNGNNIEIRNFWSYNGSPLVPDFAYFYTYDQYHRETSITRKVYKDGNWVNDSKMERIYLEGNNGDFPIQYLSQDWVDNEWENDWRLTYTYTFNNANFDTVDGIYAFWSGTDWDSHSRELYTYNSSGHVISFADFKFRNGEWNLPSMEYYYYEPYDDGALSVEDVSAELSIRLEQNPVTTQILFTGISLNKEDIVLVLYNTQGQLMLRQNTHLEAGKNNFRIPVTHLTSGLYFYNIKSKSGSVSGKVIKK